LAFATVAVQLALSPTNSGVLGAQSSVVVVVRPETLTWVDSWLRSWLVSPG
jgi:hypothetical protein